MADVACFCGCCFSFEGGAGACPKCGEVASVTGGPVPDSAGRSRAELPVPVLNGAGQNGQTPGTGGELAEADADATSGIAIEAVAGGSLRPTEGRGRRP